MPEIKTDCFAHISDDKYDGCFCLDRLYCRKENCKFYQEKKEAKRKYLDYYNLSTASLITRSTDRFFREL
jgi:hypothetical protein